MIDIQQELNNPENRVYYRYLLLDMLGVTSELSNIYIEALKDKMSTNDLLPVKRPELLYDLDSCPHLVCIGKPNQDVDSELLSASLGQVIDDLLVTKQYFCGWIVSEQTIDDLALSLQNIGVKLGTLLSMRFVPFYEPFRIQLLQESNQNDPNWIGSLLPIRTTYYYSDLQQTIKKITSDENKRFSQLFLDNKIRFFQQESVRLFRLYVLWCELQEKQNKQVTSVALSTMMRFYLDANLLGLTDIGDLSIFLFFSMQYGDLTQSLTLEKMIKDVALNSPGTLSEKFQEIDNKLPQLLFNGL